MRPEVSRTHEFERIAALPRRAVTLEYAEECAAALTPVLRAPGSRASLLPWQGLALVEAAENNGAVLWYPVGTGKTLITALLPVLLGALRPVLIVPASLRDKTRHDFQSYVGQWRCPSPWPRILSWQELTLEANGPKLCAECAPRPAGPCHTGRCTGGLLADISPDLLMVDEADEVGNPASSVARRIDRLVVDKGDALVTVLMTGTPSRKSIKGYAHHLYWALGERAPVPLPGLLGGQEEINLWAMALDDFGDRPVRRPEPGPLGRNLREAREWYAQRLAQTPGVVIVDGDSAGKVPLTVRTRYARECPKIDALFRAYILENDPPIPLPTPLDKWRFDGQAGTGFHYRYVPPGPPQEWRDARREVAKAVDTCIEASQGTARPIDTEAPAMRRLLEVGHPSALGWRVVEPTYIPETEAVWTSDATIRSVLDWLDEGAPSPGRGIPRVVQGVPSVVWCGSVEFAEALATAARLPYYGAEGKDARTGRGLHVADPARSMVSSWNANKKGFNLQAWRRHLIVHPPASAKWLEQIMGRPHRQGQTQPVIFDVLVTSGGTLDALQSALGEARFAKQTTLMTQKLLRAKIEYAPRPAATATNSYRWARKGG